MWLEERLKRASPSAPHGRHAVAVQSLPARIWRSASTRVPWLRAVICNSTDGAGRNPRALPGCRRPSCMSSPTPWTATCSIRACAPSATTILERHRHRCRVRRLSRRRARISRAADLGTTIDAFAQLAPNAHLIAVGDDNAAATPSRAGAGSRRRRSCDARLRPHVDRRPYYGAADVFVLPSHLRSLARRRARSDGVRAAGDHQHEVGRGFAVAGMRWRPRLPVRRRPPRSRRTCVSCRTGDARSPCRQRSARGAAASRRPRSRCSRCSCTGTFSRDPPVPPVAGRPASAVAAGAPIAREA